jgi:hypothetical protein
MTLKGAAFLAFVATLLTTILLTWTFIVHFLNVLRGVEPMLVLFSSFLYAFASFAITLFFFLFHQSQR